MGKQPQRQKLSRKQIITLVVLSIILTIAVPLSMSMFNKNDSSTTPPHLTDQTVPKSYRTALKTAKNYSDVMHMSKQAIADQLTTDSEKFTSKAIDYALRHLQVDYSKNALKKAKEYSDSQNMSKQAIYDQLISKGKFTVKQAQFAVDNLKVDYNQNALITAKAYQRDLNFSPATIRQVLISDKNEKFTPEQADYAIQHLNE